jgi:hypothetical protein
MRKMLLSAAATTALISAASLVPSGAQAMVLGGGPGVRTAIDAVSTIDNVGCWRPGWHGWGWYPYCGPRYYGGEIGGGVAGIGGAAGIAGTIGIEDPKRRVRS